MPNSGSDWFARNLAMVTGWSYYDKEWFNPITNLEFNGPLREAGFKCEIDFTGPIDTTKRGPLKEEFCRRYQLGKEVWMLDNIHWFLSEFDCIILLRSLSSTFPPSRLRVIQWYDQIASYLACPHEDLCSRVAYAHRVYRRAIEGYAPEYLRPVINYDDLKFNAHGALEHLLWNKWLNRDQLNTLVDLCEGSFRDKNVDAEWVFKSNNNSHLVLERNTP